MEKMNLNCDSQLKFNQYQQNRQPSLISSMSTKPTTTSHLIEHKKTTTYVNGNQGSDL